MNMREFNIGNIYLTQKKNRKPDDAVYSYREDYVIEYHTKPTESSPCTYITDLGQISIGIDKDNGKPLFIPEFEAYEYAIFTLSDKDFLDFKQVMLEFYKYFDYDVSELKLYE